MIPTIFNAAKAILPTGDGEFPDHFSARFFCGIVANMFARISISPPVNHALDKKSRGQQGSCRRLSEVLPGIYFSITP